MCHLMNRNQLPITLLGCATHLMWALVSIFFVCSEIEYYIVTDALRYWCIQVWTHWDPFLSKLKRCSGACGGSWSMNVQMDKHLEKKCWLFVKDLSSLSCVLQMYIHYLSFLYFLSVLCINSMSDQYALQYAIIIEKDRINIALKRGILQWDVLRNFQELVWSISQQHYKGIEDRIGRDLERLPCIPFLSNYTQVFLDNSGYLLNFLFDRAIVIVALLLTQAADTILLVKSCKMYLSWCKEMYLTRGTYSELKQELTIVSMVKTSFDSMKYMYCCVILKVNITRLW